MTRKIFFHEDNYCQIEILPLEAIDYCKREIEEIDNSLKINQADFGCSDVIIREKNHSELKTLHINQ